ncbi:MAG: SRPBCC domain-containing protein [Bacteroidetes bacterium]|nr:SRPBCC domain-containing protein [Bacteroidota bacterium]
MKNEIAHTVFYEHQPDAVWEYLTDAALMEQWLMKSDFKPEVGHQFMFNTRAMPDFGFDGKIYCEVKEVVPNEKLSYTWKGGPGDGTMTMDSLVTFTLTPKDGGTELLLQHTGFTEKTNPSIISLMDMGWLKNMNEIAGLLKTV